MSQATELIARQMAAGSANARVWADILYNVKLYGAKGDWNGTAGTDDTASVQATIDAAIAAGGKAVFFPHGTYKVTALTNLSSVVLFGDNASFSGISDTIGQIGKPFSNLVHNVKDYGAKGDFNTTTKTGTDDTAGVLAAIAAAKAAGGGTVFFPPGVYRITSVLEITGSNIVFDGTGATLYVHYQGSIGLFYVRGDNITFRNLTFDTDPTYLRASGDSFIFTNNVSYILIEDNIMKNCSSAAIQLTDDTEYAIVTGNRIIDSKADGIHMVNGAHDVVVSGNTLVNTGDDSISVVWYPEYVNQPRDIIIEGNIIRSSAAHGINVDHAKGILISNNEIVACVSGGISSYQWLSRTEYTEEMTIKNNLIRNCGTTTSQPGIHMDFVKNVTVQGNTIIGQAGMGILLGRFDQIHIQDNIFKNIGAAGIYLDQLNLFDKMQFIFIEGNLFDTIGKESISFRPFSTGVVINLYILNNTIYKNDYGLTSTAYVNVSKAQGLIVSNNRSYNEIDTVLIDPSCTGVTLENNYPGSPTSYTPTVLSSVGAITAYTAVGYYERRGNTVLIHAEVAITTNGTGAGFIDISLPISGLRGIVSGRETALSNKALIGEVSGTDLRLTNYDNTYPVANGSVIKMTGTYTIA